MAKRIANINKRAEESTCREREERIIFNSTLDEDDIEEVIERCCDQLDIEYDDEMNIPDEEFMKEYDAVVAETWGAEQEFLEKLFDCKEGFLILGTVHRWYGSTELGYIVHNVEEMGKAWKYCSERKLYDIDGHFFIDATCADGINYFEMKQLTQRGAEYAERHATDMSPKNLYEKLWEDGNYTKLPNYAHQFYGCPKREAKRSAPSARDLLAF